MGYAAALATEDLWRDEMAAVTVAGRAVILLRIGGEVLAYADRCPHQGVPLSAGCLSGGVLVCSAHGWEFDAASGRGLNPKDSQLQALKVKIENGWIWVDAATAEDSYADM